MARVDRLGRLPGDFQVLTGIPPEALGDLNSSPDSPDRTSLAASLGAESDAAARDCAELILLWTDRTPGARNGDGPALSQGPSLPDQVARQRWEDAEESPRAPLRFGGKSEA